MWPANTILARSESEFLNLENGDLNPPKRTLAWKVTNLEIAHFDSHQLILSHAFFTSATGTSIRMVHFHYAEPVGADANDFVCKAPALPRPVDLTARRLWPISDNANSPTVCCSGPANSRANTSDAGCFLMGSSQYFACTHASEREETNTESVAELK